MTCFGYFRFARAVLPHFRAQGSGQIINVLSMLSRGGAPLLSAYSSAKHALWGWSRSLKLELTGSGIGLSNIFVPSVATPMFDHAQSKLGFAPKPIPPTYHPRIIGRAVVRCARKPLFKVVPVFLQGSLILWMQRRIPWAGNFLMGRWGARMQMRPQPQDPRRGNLFEPVPEGVRSTGSVPPGSATGRPSRSPRRQAPPPSPFCAGRVGCSPRRELEALSPARNGLGARDSSRRPPPLLSNPPASKLGVLGRRSALRGCPYPVNAQ